jgi:trk system potassium uptake protein TrkH
LSFKQRFNALREQVNIRLYDSRDFVLGALSRLSFLVALSTIVSLIIFHGYQLTEEQNQTIGVIVRASIGYYLVKFIIEIIYDFHPWAFIKARRWEAILMVFLLIDILTINLQGVELLSLLGDAIGVSSLQSGFVLLLQFYVMVIVFLEFGKVGERLPDFNLSPPSLLIISFIILIALGTTLLMLPEMTAGAEALDFVTALFTSISASCVTGLSLIDISTVLSFKGQIIVMILMQLGGLNIISFAALFAILRGGFGMRQQNFMSENLGESMQQSGKLVGAIFRLTLTIELLGAVALGLAWFPHFDSFGNTMFHSIFHSISAFNNAGFSLFSDSLATPGAAYLPNVHWIIAVLIILGGIGFGTLSDALAQPWRKQSVVRSWRGLRLGTKIGLSVAGILLVVGGAVFALTLTFDGNVGIHLSHSFFQSITARTAGFNTIDIGAMAMPALLMLIFLMFIGGGSGSTAGGIKTSTFALVFLSAVATIRGKKDINLYKNKIPWELMNRAFAVFLFAIVFIFLGIFTLTILEPEMAFVELAFEQVSAFCTVGLSTGITADLSFGSKVVIMLSMLVGRVGTLTLAFALSGARPDSNAFTYPKGNMHVG